MAVCIRVLKCVFPLAEQVAPFTVGVMSTAAAQVILFILINQLHIDRFVISVVYFEQGMGDLHAACW